MAIVSVPTKVAVNIKYNNGTTQTGATKTVSVSIGKLSLTGYNLAKAANVVTLITACSQRSLEEVLEIKTGKFQEE